MNDFKRNKHFPEKIASNLKFLNNLQPEWSRHDTIVHQTKDLHTVDYTQLYDFLKYNQKEIVGGIGGIGLDSNVWAEMFESGCSESGCLECWKSEWGNCCSGIANQNRNGNVVAAQAEVIPRRRDAAYLQTQLVIAQKEEAGIQLQAKEFDLMAAVADLDEIEEVNANYILIANLQQALTLGTQSDKAPVYDSDESTEVQLHDNCYDDEIFNMFPQEDQYTELLEPIPELHQVLQNDSNVTSAVSSAEQGGGTVEQHPANVEETRILATKVEKVNSVNRNREETFLQSLRNKSVVRQPNAFQSECPTFSKTRVPQKVDKMNDFSNPVTSNSVPTTKESKVVENDKVIAPRMFRINPFKNSREVKYVSNKHVNASIRTNPIIDPQPHVITKKVVNSDLHGFSSTGVDITTKTRRPHPRSNTKIDRVPSASKSSRIKNKGVEVENHPRNLLFSKNKKHMSSKCNNIKLAIRNDKSEIICAMCKQCLISENHDVCVLNYVNGMNSRNKKQKVIQICLWCINSSCSKHMTWNLKLLINFVCKFMGTVRFRNDHVAAILGFDLEVDFRRNTCFVKNLKGVDLLKGNRTTNLYTINLHDMASASPICLMAWATSTKSWLWHQCLSPLNFDTINDLARNDLVTGLPKFKYHKEHLCPSCEQGKSKRASHPPKPIPHTSTRRRVLLQAPVIIVRTDNGTEFKNQVLQEYFKSVGISHQASFVHTPQQNRIVERRNRTLVEAARTMLIFSRAPLFLWAEAIATACYTQNRSIIHRRFDKTPYELINGRKPDISFLYVFGALCYPKNDREDIGKLGAKCDIGFFNGYSANSCAYIATKHDFWTNQYDDYIGGQPLAATRTAPAAQAPQVLHIRTTSTTIADTTPTPTNSASQATNIPNTSQDVDELETQQQHVPQQENKLHSNPK
ncbi:retrovirus-related pol polyprotein from transposon TNT 1-94 [Tanacetum coccineum]